MTIEDFLLAAEMNNHQSSWIDYNPELFSLIGATEELQKYAYVLAQGKSFSLPNVNVNNKKEPVNLSAALIKKFEQVNQEDYALYNRANIN